MNGGINLQTVLGFRQNRCPYSYEMEVSTKNVVLVVDYLLVVSPGSLKATKVPSRFIQAVTILSSLTTVKSCQSLQP